MSNALLVRRDLPEPATGAAAFDLARRAADALKAGAAVPFLGPGVFPTENAPIPLTPEAVAAELNRRNPAPGRIRANMWSVAQFIEQRRHRKTLAAFMLEIFRPGIAPTALHMALAGLDLPLIVDSWYDGAMRTALEAAGAASWGEVQGVTRAVDAKARWYKAYDAGAAEVPVEEASGWKTVLYKPHGSILPAGQVLVADSDYVEALTEIDIQSPIPEVVQARRAGRGFVFVGCRFHDQMLRTYARQIIKRAGGPHFAFVGDADLSLNEQRFLAAEGIAAIALEAGDLAALL